MKTSQPKPRGRPPTFDRERALDAALQVFRRHGYEGASLARLTCAMDMRPPSLYAAFGTKADLYRAAVLRYLETQAQDIDGMLDAAPTALAGTRAILHDAAERFPAEQQGEGGCFVSLAVLQCSPDADDVAAEMRARREATIERIAERFRRAERDREWSSGSDPVALARYLGMAIQGMSVQARDGADAQALKSLADIAYRGIEAATSGRV